MSSTPVGVAGALIEPRKQHGRVSRTAQSLRHPSITRIRRELSPASRGLLDAAVAAARRRGQSLWLVGGALRDCAAGMSLRDVDVSVDGDAGAVERLAEEVATAFPGASELRSYPRFGTATVRLAGRELDIAVLRSERYARPGALPEVRPGASVEQDLARRDFTVNAMALGLTGPRHGELVDPFRGLEDLAARRLRPLHARSFVDDATRLWRGARYAARLRLRPDTETDALIASGGRWLGRISARRLWVEFCRSAQERRTGAVLRLLDTWGVLAATAPGLALAPDAARALRRRPGPHEPSLLLAVMLAPLRSRAAVLERLGPPREARRAVQDAARLLALGCSLEQGPPALEQLEGSKHAGRTAALWLDPERQRPLQRALARWERTRPPLAASELARLGVARGAEFGNMLRRLRRERYVGTLSGAADARRLVKRELRGASTRREPER